MPTLKLGSTTALTESSGALTINVANPTVTLGSNADITGCTFPAGHVLQVEYSDNSYYEGNYTGTTLKEVKSASGVHWEVPITPSSDSNYIVVFLALDYSVYRGSTGTQSMWATYYVQMDIGGAGYNNVITGSHHLGMYSYGGGAIFYQKAVEIKRVSGTWSGGTGVVKFKVMYSVGDGAGNAGADHVSINNTGYGTQTSTMTLMEIQG